MKATLNKIILALSNETKIVEGNHYFPPESVLREFLKESAHVTTCPWKGVAHYYDALVDGRPYKDVAWYYPDPKEAAKEIKNHVAFSRDVAVTE